MLKWLLLLLSMGLWRTRGNPNYDPRKVQDGHQTELTEPLRGVVILHCEGWDSIRPRGSNWLRETIWPAHRFTHISINDYHIMKYLALNQTAPHVIPTVLVYNVENSGTDALYHLPRTLIALYNIKLVFNPSDEWKAWGKKYFYGEGTELYPLVDVAFREYSVVPYRDAQHPHRNVIQIPLNYPDAYLHEPRHLPQPPPVNSTVYRDEYHEHMAYYSGIEIMKKAIQIKAINRYYLWSFVGSLQGANKGYAERHTVVVLYQDVYVPNFISVKMPTSSVYEIYKNSKFVVVMKGQYNIECFRYTEASFAGAIPVIVADEYEKNMEYHFEGNPPPFLYDTNYERAFQRMAAMSNDTIDEMRHNISLWYEKRIHNVQNITMHAGTVQHQRVFGHHRFMHKTNETGHH